MGSLKDFFSKKPDTTNQDPHQYDRLGLTPLLHAVINHDREKIEKLLEAGANINQGSGPKTLLGMAEDVDYPKNTTALHLIAFYPQAEIAELLVQKGAQLDAKDAAKRTPLDYAIMMYQNFGGQKYVKKPWRPGYKQKMEQAEASAEAVINVLLRAGAEQNDMRIPDTLAKKHRVWQDEQKTKKQGPGPSAPF